MNPHFDGATYDAVRDHVRLKSQLERVKQAMSDGLWHTLEDLENVAAAPQSSVSARIRDLRKAKFGGYQIERRNFGDGLWRYRMGKL